MDRADQRIRPLSLRQNFVWVMLGRGIYAACQWGVVAVLARQGPELLGRYALGVAVCLPVFMFANLKLDGVLVTDSRDDFAFPDYLALRLVSSTLALLVIALIMPIAGYAWDSAVIIMAVGCGQAVLSVREVFLARARKAERMDGVAASHAILGIIGLSAFAAAISVTGNLLIAILTLVLVRLAALLFLDRVNLKRIAADADRGETPQPVPWAQILRLARLAAPLGLVGVLLSIALNAPRYMIESHHGQAVLGYLAALASLPAIGTILIAALGQAASPRLARYFIENRRAFVYLLGRMIAVSIAIGLTAVAAAYWLGRPILTFCFSAEFAAHQTEFVWVMLAGALMYVWSFLETALTAARKFRVQVPIYGTATVAALIAGWLLIPRYSLLGAALTLVIVPAVGIIGTGWAVACALLRAGPSMVSATDASQT